MQRGLLNLAEDMLTIKAIIPSVFLGLFLVFSHPVVAEGQTSLSPRHPVPQCGKATSMHESFTSEGKLWKTLVLDDNHIINHYMHNDGRWVLVLINSVGIGCILQGGTRWYFKKTIEG